MSRGWQLERIHDLNRLLDLSTQHHCDFSAFQQLAQSLTEQFWAQHYPGDDLSDVGLDFLILRTQTSDLVALIEREK